VNRVPHFARSVRIRAHPWPELPFAGVHGLAGFDKRTGGEPQLFLLWNLEKRGPAPHPLTQPTARDYFFSASAGLAALPFNSTTIKSNPASPVFSGKWVVLAAYCASPALRAKLSCFPSG